MRVFSQPQRERGRGEKRASVGACAHLPFLSLLSTRKGGERERAKSERTKSERALLVFTFSLSKKKKEGKKKKINHAPLLFSSRPGGRGRPGPLRVGQVRHDGPLCQLDLPARGRPPRQARRGAAACQGKEMIFFVFFRPRWWFALCVFSLSLLCASVSTPRSSSPRQRTPLAERASCLDSSSGENAVVGGRKGGRAGDALEEQGGAFFFFSSFASLSSLQQQLTTPLLLSHSTHFDRPTPARRSSSGLLRTTKCTRTSRYARMGVGGGDVFFFFFFFFFFFRCDAPLARTGKKLDPDDPRDLHALSLSLSLSHLSFSTHPTLSLSPPPHRSSSAASRPGSTTSTLSSSTTSSPPQSPLFGSG